ncbi:DUF305 domain-containing protein [Nocardiopsis composta]|uniref:Uncharacterized protein (DUF305 family) n=1 Tax=Nocardiopsis composta TaxID=157465 RepID=A0A7W8VE57_9ACTN|nr:DUF305 domain-containing protein [Nocardiopsis composta]MBB5432745.1 uncharacterized protein (DUF305 family) [Nocardiopsis composta]
MAPNKRVFLLPAALASALLLSACGGSPEGSGGPAGDGAAPSAEFNSADVMFAQMMIPHHEQALEMAELAEGRSGPEVGDLAERIEEAQGPEIEQLTAMLDEWGEPVEAEMDHEMDGMLTEEQLADLEAADGDAFDELFLEQMIEHHEGAVEMAQTQLDEGVNAEATELATAVVEAQEAEISEMRGLLGEPSEAPASEDASGAGGGHSGH